MPHRRLLGIAVLIGLLNPPRIAQVLSAEPLPAAPQVRVLLLRNHNIIQGKILRVGAAYRVQLRDGEIELPESEVELMGHSLDEIYDRLQQRIHEDQVDDHLQLAEWCLRYRLYGYAAREIMAAQQANPRHPRIALLERRLFAATKPLDAPARDQRSSPTDRPQPNRAPLTSRRSAGPRDPFDPEIFNSRYHPGR